MKRLFESEGPTSFIPTRKNLKNLKIAILLICQHSQEHQIWDELQRFMVARVAKYTSAVLLGIANTYICV